MKTRIAIIVLVVIIGGFFLYWNVTLHPRSVPGLKLVGKDMDIPAWSRSDQSIFFFSLDSRNDFKLCRYDAKTGNTRFYTMPGDMYLHDISPDNRNLLFTKSNDNAAYTRQLSGGTPKLVFRPVEKKNQIGHVLWPAQSYMLFMFNNKFDIYRINEKRKEEKFLSDVSTYWPSSDGTAFAWWKGQAFLYDFETGKNKQLDLPAGAIRDNRLSFIYLSNRLAIVWYKLSQTRYIELIELKTMKTERLEMSRIIPEQCQRAICGHGHMVDNISL